MSLNNRVLCGNRRPTDRRPDHVVADEQMAEWGVTRGWRQAWGRCWSWVQPWLIHTVDRSGLEALVKAGMAAAKAAGYDLPYNLPTYGPALGRRRVGKFRDPDGFYLEAYARFGGWLRRLAVARTPLLRRLIKKTVSGNGVNSPWTTTDLWALSVKYSSPEKADRKLAEVIRRADQILQPYGLRTAWSALGQALCQDGRVGKAALWAANETTRIVLRKLGVWLQVQPHDRTAYLRAARGWQELAAKDNPALAAWVAARLLAGEFGSIREALQASDRLQEAVIDGFPVVLDQPVVELVQADLTATAGYMANGQIWQVKNRWGQSYRIHRWGQEDLPIDWQVEEALAVWKDQDAALAEEVLKADAAAKQGAEEKERQELLLIIAEAAGWPRKKVEGYCTRKGYGEGYEIWTDPEKGTVRVESRETARFSYGGRRSEVRSLDALRECLQQVREREVERVEERRQSEIMCKNLRALMHTPPPES